MRASQTTESKVTAIVPMRHESKRIPEKNFRPFSGKPLYHYILEALLACKTVSSVVTDTDSPVILAEVPGRFPDVKLLERPSHLRNDRIPMNEVLLNCVAQLPGEFFLQTHSTNPLLTPSTIDRAVELFFENRGSHDSLFSVTRIQARLWDSQGRPLNHDPDVLLRTQDLPPVYLENSCIYLFSRSTLEESRNRIGKAPFIFEIDQSEAWDIDEISDFRLGEMLYRQRLAVKEVSGGGAAD